MNHEQGLFLMYKIAELPTQFDSISGLPTLDNEGTHIEHARDVQDTWAVRSVT
jgi:hypothetical protein